MTGLFVRGLWGPGPGVTDTERCRPWNTAIQAMMATVGAPFGYPPNSEQVIVCYGEENYKLCKTFAFDTVQLSDLSIVNWEATEREMGPVDWSYWGTSTWRHKIEAIAYALTLADHVVWLDWDTRQVAPLPTDFWQQRAAGPPLQAALRMYHRRQCSWRPQCRRVVPHGAWLYVRGKETIDAIREAHRTHCPLCTDEIAIARMLDDQNGGWIGNEEWLRRGYDPGCYSQGRAGRWRTIHRIPSAKRLFENVGQY